MKMPEQKISRKVLKTMAKKLVFAFVLMSTWRLFGTKGQGLSLTFDQGLVF